MKRARVAKQQTTPSKYKKTSKKAPLVMYKTPKDPVRLYKRTSDYFSLPISGATGALGAYAFQLSNIPNSSEFTSLYDQYKINAVSVCFYPKQTQVTSLSTTDNIRANARILTAIDYNDDTPPTTLDELRQYDNCEVDVIVNKHERYIPKPLFLNNSGQNVNSWLSTANPSTRHYGLKYGVEPTQAVGASFTYNVEVTYYIAFKNTK